MKSVFPQPNKKNGAAKAAEISLANDMSTEKLLDESPVAIYICDAHGVIKFYNKAAEDLWGKKPEPDKGSVWDSFKIYSPHGKPISLYETPMAKTIREGVACENETIIIERPGGRSKNILVFSRPIFDENNQLNGSYNTLVDVTPQKNEGLAQATFQIQTRGEEKQAVLSAIVESSDDAIISKDLQGKIMSWNSGAEKIFGYAENEVIGKSITILIPEERLKEEDRILGNIRKGNKIDHFETIRKHKNGTEIAISLTVSPVKDSAGNIIGASKVARDISEQIAAKKDIMRYTKNLEILNSVGRDIFENLDVQVILQRVTDATTKLTGASFGAFFYNHKVREDHSFKLFALSGVSRKEFEKPGISKHTKMFLPTFLNKEVVRVENIKTDARYDNNHSLFGMPNHNMPVVSFLAVPVVSKSGAVIGGLLFGHSKSNVFTAEHEAMVMNIAAQAAISLDNSELFEQVKSLSEKKDEFIALASHELKTPLTTIKGYLQVLAKQEKDKMSTLFLKKSLNQVNKLNTLVEDLLNMSRIEAGKLEFNWEVFDIRQMLLELVETFSYSHKTHKIIHDLGEKKILVKGDKQRIEQAVINLMTNAIKYSPEADKVYLTLKTEKSTIKVSVRDEGIGLTEEQQSQLFTRFYRAESTKGISGLGLGLYLTKQIIDRHNGVINLNSKAGEGSEFYFTLPL